ncbi:hypothetical protein ICW40_00605 [Actinotalea ferrariae]|uniref:hypothetical protein n=1 Tax=Actinotalea ferrariae TaxID=1386098 RepID=UPI001C8CA484|nr:hypothetical protein [Actinotalea ferrariae]MBX9243309.1 hypothetical protein [Actinotalea ferrariae]
MAHSTTSPSRTRSAHARELRGHETHAHREMPDAPRGRGVAVYVEVPTGDGFPDSGELLDLAGALYELAQDLVPGATTRTEVRLVDDEPGTTA